MKVGRPTFVVVAVLSVLPSQAALAQDDNPRRRLQYFLDQRSSPGVTDYSARLQRARGQLVDLGRSGGGPLAAPMAGTWTALGPEQIGSQGIYTGRASAIAIHPTSLSTIYVGGAQGGVWKTTNGGASWTPLTDQECSLAMGSIAIDPVDPDIVYAGTGEQHFSIDSYYGCGVLRSLDGGTNWQQLGASTFQFSGGGGARISRVIVDPATAGSASSTRVYVAATNGLWVSDDSGASWARTLTGAAVTDLVMNPSAPSTLFAAQYGQGVFRSDDSGASWTSLVIGHATGSFERVNLALSLSDPGRVYAALADDDGSLAALIRTDDGGTTWVDPDPTPFSFCGSQCWYDLALAVHPTDPDVLYAGGVSFHRSDDAGMSLSSRMAEASGASMHVDQHLIVVDPRLPESVWVVNDGGIYQSANRGDLWTSLNSNLSFTQFYGGISIHPTDPTIVLGGTQDNGTVESQGTFLWNRVAGGDGGFTAIDPIDPDLRYHEFQWNFGPRTSRRSGGPTVGGSNGIDLSDEAAFIPPMVMDPMDPSVLYFGTTRIYRTTNGAAQWDPISPHLLSNDITAIATSRSDGDVVYVGTRDGRLHRTATGGSVWTELSSGLPNRWLTDIAVHPTDPAVAYVSASGFGTGHVFSTDNGGATWTDISGNLTDVPVNAILIDPSDPAVLYIGTDLGVWWGTPQGVWTPYRDGLPIVAVFDLAAEPNSGLLVAATHGRGMYSLPISAPLELVVRGRDVAATVFTGAPVASDSNRVGAFGTGWAAASWSVTSSQGSWLTASAPNNVGRGTVGWSVDMTGLAPATYEDSIFVDVPGAAGSPAKVTVMIDVQPSDTLSFLGPSSRLHEVLVGSTQASTDSARVLLAGPHVAGVDWSATHGGGSWLTVGTASGDSGQVVRWTRDPTGLTEGAHVDTVLVANDFAAASPLQLVDTLLVSPPLDLAFGATTASRAASVLGVADELEDTVVVHFTGFGRDTASWQASSRAIDAGGPHGEARVLHVSQGVNGSSLVWSREAGTLATGIHVDTMRVEAVSDPSVFVEIIDTLVVADPLSADQSAAELLDGGVLAAEQVEALDRLGNSNGALDLGDVASWVIRCQGGGSPNCIPAGPAQSPGPAPPSQPSPAPDITESPARDAPAGAAGGPDGRAGR